jgi:hypothetical protein
MEEEERKSADSIYTGAIVAFATLLIMCELISFCKASLI